VRFQIEDGRAEDFELCGENDVRMCSITAGIKRGDVLLVGNECL
jgi:hypothetical protein